jgi:hypothetical protein
VGIIQDYDDKKKQYHNLEKDYVVHGEHGRFLISRGGMKMGRAILIPPMAGATVLLVIFSVSGTWAAPQGPSFCGAGVSSAFEIGGIGEPFHERASSEPGLNVTCRHRPGTLSPQPLEERVRERAAPTIPSRG